MTTDEFDQTVIRTESKNEIILDARPFGKRQAEAVEFYMRKTNLAVTDGRVSNSKLVLVLCDRETDISPSTMYWLRLLTARGIPLDVREEETES